jgi:hypothetical protein
MKKFIFLDMDGVVNSFRASVGLGGNPWPADNDTYQYLDPVALGLLRIFVNQGVEIILSSTWRLSFKTPETLKEFGDLIGLPIKRKTPMLGRARGFEIQKVVDDLIYEFDEIEYCIVDDDSDMLDFQKEFFVRTEYNNGYTWETHHEIARILNVEPYHMKIGF